MELPVHRYRGILIISIQIHIYDVTDDVTKSQGNSNFKITMYPSIFQIEHGSKAQSIGKAQGWLPCWYIKLPVSLPAKKKNCRDFKMTTISKILKFHTQLQFDLRYEKIVPNYTKKGIFHGDDVIDDVTGWPEICPLYSSLGEVGSGSKLQGQCLVNICEYHNRLCRLYLPKEDLNE